MVCIVVLFNILTSATPGQIAALMRNHDKAFSDIKNYYNDITLNNLSLIDTLKEQVSQCVLLGSVPYVWSG